MRVIFEDEKKRISLKNGTAIAIGNFDGIHIAHNRIINLLKEESQKRELKSIIYTFAKHPENVLANRIFTPQITTNSQKIKLIKDKEIDYLYFARFTEKFSNIEPEDFINKILISKFKMKLIIVGEDYRFGHRAKGNIDLLKKLAKKYNFEILIIPNMYYECQEVRSSNVRREIVQGNIERANNLINRIYEIETKTCNIEFDGTYKMVNSITDSYLLIPKYGIYITQVNIDNKKYNSITIVKGEELSSEKDILQTIILDFDYETHQIPNFLDIEFYKKIRNYKETINVDSDKVNKQMEMDIRLVKNYFKLENKKQLTF